MNATIIYCYFIHILFIPVLNTVKYKEFVVVRKELHI